MNTILIPLLVHALATTASDGLEDVDCITIVDQVYVTVAGARTITCEQRICADRSPEVVCLDDSGNECAYQYSMSCTGRACGDCVTMGVYQCTDGRAAICEDSLLVRGGIALLPAP